MLVKLFVNASIKVLHPIVPVLVSVWICQPTKYQPSGKFFSNLYSNRCKVFPNNADVVLISNKSSATCFTKQKKLLGFFTPIIYSKSHAGNTNTTLANFASPHFPHFTAFRNQTIGNFTIFRMLFLALLIEVVRTKCTL